MGLTQAEFMKLVAAGKVTSKEFMLPFARQLRTMVRENDALATATKKLTARQQRLTSAFKDMIDQTFQGGLAESIGRLFDLTTKFVRWITPFFKTVMIGVGGIVELVAEATYTIFELINAIGSLGSEASFITIPQVWNAVKVFFLELAAAVWDVIGGIQYLSAMIRGDVGLPTLEGFATKANDVLSMIPMTPSYIAKNMSQGGGGVTVQGDVNVKYDGSQSVVDDILTQFGF